MTKRLSDYGEKTIANKLNEFRLDFGELSGFRMTTSKIRQKKFRLIISNWKLQ